MKTTWMVLAFSVIFVASTASAEPLVTMSGGKASPGVVTAWSGSGKKITLTLKAGTDAEAVAASISSNVDKVKAKVAAGKVLVIGKTQDELLAALGEVDFGGEDDLGALAAAAVSEDDGGSGSSLRAKKTARLDKIFRDRGATAMGKVVSVKSATFPTTVVSVRILRGPTGALGKEIRKGKTIAFEPVIPMKGGLPDLSTEDGQTNLGGWYLEKGDRVQVKIGKKKGAAYEALVISR